MKRKTLLLISTVLVMSLTLVWGVSAQETNENIVDVIATDGRFDTLYAAVVAADLEDTLASADNTFTVFAPRDGAFNAVEAANPGLLGALLADPDGALTTILTYHVVPGRYMSGDVLEAGTLTTVNGEDLTITTRGDQVFVNDARVITVDIPAKNGVIHVIDSVLLPSDVVLPEVTPPGMAPISPTTPQAAALVTGLDAEALAGRTIAQIAADTGQFTQLLGALEATGLAETFTRPGNYTVFAPTDAAFEALGFTPTQDELRAILLYHVVGDQLTRDQLATDDLVPTLEGRPLIVNRDGPIIQDISGAKVLIYNIPASNGIIHVIDRVMVP